MKTKIPLSLLEKKESIIYVLDTFKVNIHKNVTVDSLLRVLNEMSPTARVDDFGRYEEPDDDWGWIKFINKSVKKEKEDEKIHS